MRDATRKLADLAQLTPSRVRLQAEASPLPLSHLLAFQEDHAAARDAIFEKVGWAALEAELLPVARLRSQAESRAEYLKRPDLGRQLASGQDVPCAPGSLVIVVADGLCPPALAQAAPLVHRLREVCPMAQDAPVVLAEQARVTLGDPICRAMGARAVLVLIGERPGLTVASSLGAYLTWAPQIATRDSQRNCVSNIHASGGLSPQQGADRIAWLIDAAERLGATGVTLKDRSDERATLSD